MGFWEELQERRQPDGLIVPRGKNPGPDSTGNGILYLSLAHVCAVLNGLDPNHAEFLDIIRTCKDKNGFLNRSPTKKDDQNGWDDYIGACCAFQVMGAHKPAWELCDAGNRRHFLFFKWFYKNNKPHEFSLFSKETWQAWFGRNPTVVTHIQSCAWVYPHFFRRLWLTADLIYTALRKMDEPDSVILMRLMSLPWERRWFKPWYIDWASKFFKKRLVSKYGSLRGVLKERLDADHPIVTYWPEGT